MLATRLVTAVCICAAPFTAYAHHSHGMFYDPCTSVTIDGKVEAVQWKNPHVLVDVKTDDGTAYRAEWTSLQGLINGAAAGSAQDAVSVGERIVFTGNPMRAPAQIRASVPDFKIDPALRIIDVTQIRRASDSWNWSRAPESIPAGCGRK
jgi:hypothetical protein